MSTNYHSPLPFGGPLTAVGMEAPLGQLDAAISNVIATGSGVATTLTAQANAGQGTLVVASSAGFAIGDPIYIGTGGTGGADSRIVATVPDGTHITVTVNLSNTYAVGRPVSKSPVEIVDARGGMPTLGARLNSMETAFNIKRFGAQGDGTTNDSAAIEAASVALAAAGGGILYAPPGTYLVDWFVIPGWAGFYAGVIVRSGCTLVGAGMGATTIKLKANAASYSSAGMIRNGDMDGGDERIAIKDITIDGNGANQTTLYQGVDWQRVRGVRHERVRVMNVRGTSNFPPGETFLFNAFGSTDVFYSDCEALGSAGTHGSGFATNQCTNVHRVNCLVHGMSAGMGFADWSSRGILNVNCTAQQNGTQGFNAEYCEDYVCVGCRGGGRASAGAGNYPFAADAALGNAGAGFVINATKRAILDACFAERNAANGASIVNTGVDESQCQIRGGYYGNNTGAGIYFGTVATARACSVSLDTVFESNTNDLTLNGGIGATSAQAVLPSPAVPASGVALTNDFPFEVTIYVVAGTLNFLSINGATVTCSGGAGQVNTVRLQPGGTILWNGSVAPTWVWSRR